MDKQVIRAYDKLVPADQLIIDAMIAALSVKDREVSSLTKELIRLVNEKEELE